MEFSKLSQVQEKRKTFMIKRTLQNPTSPSNNTPPPPPIYGRFSLPKISAFLSPLGKAYRLCPRGRVASLFKFHSPHLWPSAPSPGTHVGSGIDPNPASFTIDRIPYTISALYKQDTGAGSEFLSFALPDGARAPDENLVLQLGDDKFFFDAARYNSGAFTNTYIWDDDGLIWTAGVDVDVKIIEKITTCP